MAVGYADHKTGQTIRLDEPEPFSGLNHFIAPVATCNF
jgi:hypothetical protein